MEEESQVPLKQTTSVMSEQLQNSNQHKTLTMNQQYLTHELIQHDYIHNCLKSQTKMDSLDSPLPILKKQLTTSYVNNQSLMVSIDQLSQDMMRLIEQSTADDKDKIAVVEEEENKHFDTLEVALSQYILINPSKNQIYPDESYLTKRRSEIQANISKEIDNIDSLLDKAAKNVRNEDFTQIGGNGVKLNMHFKDIFQKEKDFLVPFLEAQRTLLQRIFRKLKAQIPSSESVLNTTLTRIQNKEQELHNLELLVFKAAIALERVNYYTMAQTILPRDNVLRPISLFENESDYNLQSCRKICDLILDQIKRLEQIEIQIYKQEQGQNRMQFSQSISGTSRNSSNYSSKRESTFLDVQRQKSVAIKKEDSNQKLVGSNCKFSQEQKFKIWQEFSREQSIEELISKSFSRQKPVEELISKIKLNLHLRVASYEQQKPTKIQESYYENQYFQANFQLFSSKWTPISEIYQIQNKDDSWMITEISFTETLLKNDMFMLITLSTVNKIEREFVLDDFCVFQDAKSDVVSSYVKAYTIINLCDYFLEERIDGESFLLPRSSNPQITFVNFAFVHQKKFIQNLDKSTLEQLVDQNQLISDPELSKPFNLTFDATFFTSINKNELPLNLAKSVTIRHRNFWNEMDQYTSEDNFSKDIVELNLEELQNVRNEIKLSVNQLKLNEQLYRQSDTFCKIEVYLVDFQDKYEPKVVQHMIKSPITPNEAKEFINCFSTPTTLLKNSEAQINAEISVKMPEWQKGKSLDKHLDQYSLVFLVLQPLDIENQVPQASITVSHLLFEPTRYMYLPKFFAKLSLKYVLNSKKEDTTNLYAFKTVYQEEPYLKQLDDLAVLKHVGNLTVTYQLMSSQYVPKSDQLWQMIQDPKWPIQGLETLKNNQILQYHRRIFQSLLEMTSDKETQISYFGMQQIFKMFEKFEKPLILYKSLIEDTSKLWDTQQFQDTNLLENLIAKLNEIEKMISQLMKQSLDQVVNQKHLDDLKQTLKYLPHLLTIMITLYTVDFKNQFNQIADKINQTFNKKIDFDLGENETEFSSKEAYFYKRIIILKESITTKQLFESQDERKSIILDQNLNKKIDLMKEGFEKFSLSIKNIIINISSSLHQSYNKIDVPKQIEVEGPNLTFEGLKSSIMERAQKNLISYFKCRNDLRNNFVENLEQILYTITKIIDTDFLKQIFDEKYLLRKLESTELIELTIENDSQYNSIQKFLQVPDLKALLQNKLDESSSRIWSEIQNEIEKLTNQQVKTKVKMLSQFLTSDVLFLVTGQEISEIIDAQDLIATRISTCVYNLLRQYKSKPTENNEFERKKDIFESEQLYCFLYSISEFEKKHQQLKRRKSDNLLDDLSNDEEDSVLSRSSKYGNTFIFEDLEQSKAVIISQLGKSKRQFDDQQNLLQKFSQFDSSKSRICYFFNEIEDVLDRYWELKLVELENSKQFPMILLQLLSKLCENVSTQLNVTAAIHECQMQIANDENMMVLLWDAKPGRLDRLIGQVSKILFKLQFGYSDFFFKLKRQQIVDNFCKNVIFIFCDSEKKKEIALTNVNYTYRSILSQVWLLQLKLYTEEIVLMHEYIKISSFIQKAQTWQQSDENIKNFEQRISMHHKSLLHLFNSYKECTGLLLPDINIAQQERIWTDLNSILSNDLKNKNLKEISETKIKKIFQPLVVMYMQVEELEFRIHEKLSLRVSEQIIQDFFSASSSVTIEEQNKKKQMCEAMCGLLQIEVNKIHHSLFKEKIQQQVADLERLKNTYFNVIDYEQNSYQTGNLLAQLIEFSRLMFSLQKQNLFFPFHAYIDRYNNMMKKIEDKLKRNAHQVFVQLQNLQSFQVKKKTLGQIEQQYTNQIYEVLAFMHVENYFTFKRALDLNLIKKESIANIKMHEILNEKAVEVLTNTPDDHDRISQNNKYFEMALKLLNFRQTYEEKKYEFDKVIDTLKAYDHLYEEQCKFIPNIEICCYFIITIENYLPKQIRVEGRHFIYRTSAGYSKIEMKSDIATLLDLSPTDLNDSYFELVQPLTWKVKQKYDLAEHCFSSNDQQFEETVYVSDHMKIYYEQNYKNQFYVESIDQGTMNTLAEQYIITVYEVQKTFPTMTMIQPVFQQIIQKTRKSVEIRLDEVRMIIQELQQVLKELTFEPKSQEAESNKLKELLETYLVMNNKLCFSSVLETFFSQQKEKLFKEIEFELQRSYLNLFKALDLWFTELNSVHEALQRIGVAVQEIRSLGIRLNQVHRILQEKRQLYKIKKLSTYC